jgi:hypothetical protein
MLDRTGGNRGFEDRKITSLLERKAEIALVFTPLEIL